MEKPLNILIVDDSIAMRKAIVKSMDCFDALVSQAVMDGLTLCRKLHRDSRRASIPFITMSSEDDRYRMRQILQCGASTYINKPFHIDQLVVMTERLLSDHYRLALKERERLETEQRNMISSISSLIRALEARDQYTRGHSDAVSEEL
jgi:putative two-component system response regulator